MQANKATKADAAKLIERTTELGWKVTNEAGVVQLISPMVGREWFTITMCNVDSHPSVRTSAWYNRETKAGLWHAQNAIVSWVKAEKEQLALK